MFRLIDNAISPHRPRFESAVKRLPGAHIRAQDAGMAHLHRSVVSAVDSAGLDSSPISVVWHKGTASLGIGPGPAGDVLADNEFGRAADEKRPEIVPNPVLRTAARAALPAANKTYSSAMYQELGL